MLGFGKDPSHLILCNSIFSCSGVFYGKSLSLSETHAAIKQSYAVVNSSLHEGMCTAILEVCEYIIISLCGINVFLIIWLTQYSLHISRERPRYLYKPD